MTTLTLRLSENLLHELADRAEFMHIPRSEYIRRAIEHMNAEVLKQERYQALQKVSLRVRDESMQVNKEFGDIEHDPKT